MERSIGPSYHGAIHRSIRYEKILATFRYGAVHSYYFVEQFLNQIRYGVVYNYYVMEQSKAPLRHGAIQNGRDLPTVRVLMPKKTIELRVSLSAIYVVNTAA